MKIALLLVSAVAVFTADLPDFPDNTDGGSPVPDHDKLARLDPSEDQEVMKEEESRVKKKLRGCRCPSSPKGLFYFAESDQCFKRLGKYNWTTASSTCQQEGLRLAHPYEPAALNHYLLARYGTAAPFTWVGAKGTGSYMKFEDGTFMTNDNPLWWVTGSGAKSTSECMGMLTHPSYIKSKPEQPYHWWNCTSSLWALCEWVRN